MLRLILAIVTAWACAVLFADKAHASTNALGHIDRTIVKEPVYESTPKYCLIALGSNADVKVWMVEDGKRLFVDKNANGDLTDDGSPIKPSDVRNVSPTHWDFNYVLDAITPADGSRHTHFDLRRWNYGEKEDSYGLSLSVDDKLPVYAGWFGTFWSTNRETAPIIHFGGAFAPKLLRRKDFTVGSGKQDRLSIGFFNPGSGPGADSRLSIEALPKQMVPKLSIEWPTAADSPPLRTSHKLTERCCYWEFYTTDFEVPKGIVAGKAKISVHFFPDVTPIELTTTEIQASVIAPTAESKAAQ